MARREVADACGLELPSGKVRVLWDRRAAATPLGQMPCFIEFLHVSGLWQRWLEDCPLSYISPNAPTRGFLRCKLRATSASPLTNRG